MTDSERILVQMAERALRNVHGDTTVPLEQTLYDLQCLRDVTLDLIQAVEWDIKQQSAREARTPD